MVIYTMMMMTTDDTGAWYDDRAMYILSDMSHVLDMITDRKVGGILMYSPWEQFDDVLYVCNDDDDGSLRYDHRVMYVLHDN